MLYSLLNGGFSIQNALMHILAVSFIVFLVMPLHEFAHGFVAYKLGDKTAKNMGRLRFSPSAHIDPIGALMILLVGFGWAKPVPVNPRNFKNPKVGMAITAVAGPVSNLLAALVGGLFVNGLIALVYNVSMPEFMYTVLNLIYTFFSYFLSVNISLAVFNLIPIPPLDGSKILFAFLPDKLVYKIYQYERQFNTALILLIALGALTGPLNFLNSIFTQLIIQVTSLPFLGLY
ncbi:MAG: site-2 protease family protein [Acutalibacteraceae bacterium]|nr:site-2 protease family protein [Acutalibacteraceae bacterium]